MFGNFFGNFLGDFGGGEGDPPAASTQTPLDLRRQRLHRRLRWWFANRRRRS